ncbi:uncharacterized protein LOC112127431 [Cimex lectularius]|uniref:Uncharacterized protein n=1 Tax=Cimex lectularius TaxID=79782 RepID=A0A8I6TMJ8_CIMLE|nr:uncharacterized protein LOC112127431 [Cimex lectularius]
MSLLLKSLVLCVVIVYVAGQEGSEEQIDEEGRTFGRPFAKLAGAVAHGIGYLLLDGDNHHYYRPPYNYYNRPFPGVYGGGFANQYYRPGFPGYRDPIFDNK